jgi:hypothetical protein
MSYENFEALNPFTARQSLMKSVDEKSDSGEPYTFDDDVKLKVGVVLSCFDKTLEDIDNKRILDKSDRGMVRLARLVLDAKGKPGGFIKEDYTVERKQEEQERAVKAVEEFYEIMDKDFGLAEWVEEVKEVREKEDAPSDEEIDRLVMEYVKDKRVSAKVKSDRFWRSSARDLALFALGRSLRDGTSPGEIVPEYKKFLPEDFVVLLERVMHTR